MSRPFPVVAVAFLLLAKAGLASELPYGGDSLPYLSSRSDAVVIATLEAPADLDNEEAVGARLFLREVLKGDLRLLNTNLLAVTIRPPQQETLFPGDGDYLVFLRGPLLPDLHRAFWRPSDRTVPLFEIVSGAFGVFRYDENDPVIIAATEFVYNDSPSSHLKWARQYLDSETPFLQRAAHLAFSQPKVRAARDEVLALASDSLFQEAIASANKKIVFRILEYTQSQEAVNLLSEFTTSPVSTSSLREQAVLTMSRIPAGLKTLRDWSSPTNESLSLALFPLSGLETRLRDWSRAALQPIDHTRDATRDIVLDLRQALDSQSESTRLEVVDSLPREVDSAALSLLRQVVSDDPSPSVRVRALNALTQRSVDTVAEFLADVVIDESQFSIVRNEALLGLGNMPSGYSLDALESVLLYLPPEDELRIIALGLVSQ